MNLSPSFVASFPDARLAASGSCRFAIDDSLRQPGIAEYDVVCANPAQVRANHGHGYRRLTGAGIRRFNA